MQRLRLFHWKPEEGRQRLKQLEAAGYVVDYEPLSAALLKSLRTAPPPLAIVIDLSRAPSQGRDIALAVRQFRATRHAPLVFVEGEAEKRARIQALLPDATYTDWRRIRSALKRAVANPPAAPVVPKSLLAGYSGTPLPKKLGIKPGSVVALLGAPAGFDKTLGPLPEGAVLRTRVSGRTDLILWFTRRSKVLEGRVKRMAAGVGPGGLWILWPKQASGTPSDLTQAVVRRIGLASGLVDYKVCAVDATWSGLKFARRKRA